MKDVISGLKTKLTESARRNNVKALLFSGGLDSAILASTNSRIRTITVSLMQYGEDIKYAAQFARKLRKKLGDDAKVQQRSCRVIVVPEI